MSTSLVSPSQPIDTNALINAAKLVALFSNKSIAVNSNAVSDFEAKYANEIKYVKTIISDDPSFLDSISDNLNQIVADGKVSVHDIPQIVLVISKVIKLNFRKIVNNINVLSVVEYILHALLNSGLLPIPKVEKEILNKVIEASFKLLEMNSEVIETKCKNCWFSCCH
jgi:hypothetical protein